MQNGQAVATRGRRSIIFVIAGSVVHAAIPRIASASEGGFFTHRRQTQHTDARTVIGDFVVDGAWVVIVACTTGCTQGKSVNDYSR